MPALPALVVLVTGASSGIGEAMARRLVQGGARVVLTARRADWLKKLARELDPTGENVFAVPADVTNEMDRNQLIGEALNRFGRIDVLVNNAGFGTRGPVERVPVEAI